MALCHLSPSLFNEPQFEIPVKKAVQNKICAIGRQNKLTSLTEDNWKLKCNIFLTG